MNTDGPLRDKSELFVEIYFKIAACLFYVGAIALIGGFFTLWTVPILPVVIATATGALMVVGAFIFMLWAANR